MRFIIYYLLFIISFCVPAFGQGGQITQGGAAYSITSPYASEDLFGIQYIQSADIMYFSHIKYPLMILTRMGDTQWTLEEVDMGKGVFMNENEDESWTITPSGTSGDITLTASADTFHADQVGGLFRLTHPVDATIIANTRFVRGDSTSSELTVELNRDFTAKIGQSNYVLEGDITLQKSYDGSTWLDVYEMRTTTPEVIYMGTETVADAVYRFNFDGIQYLYAGPNYPKPTYTLIAHQFEKEGIVEITGVSTPRFANATVLYELGAKSATYKWAEGSFSGFRGYPAAVCIHQERLVLGGTLAEPDTVWLSQTNDWHNFLVNNLDTSALTFTMAADQVNAIRWLKSHNSLMIGTSGGEWELAAAPGKALTQTNVPTIRRQSTYGSAPIQSLLINNKIVYVQRNAKKILRMNYWYENNNWNSVDMTLLAENISEDGIIEMAYQRTPFSVLWSVCGNGDLLALVLEDNQEVMGWSRYVFDGDCESVAVIPGTGEDKVWIIIARIINGVPKRYIEQFMPFDFEDQDSMFYVDSGLSFDYGPAISVTNATQADPIVITAPEHTFSDGDQVRFSSIGGMTELNNAVFTVSTISGASFEMRDRTDAVDINSVDFTTYTSGGTLEQVENTFSSLGHLESESVVAAGDGGYAGAYTVVSNSVTLTDYYNRVHIGLPYTAKLKPMRLDFLATGGGLQGRTKRISATTLRFYETLSCSIGPTWDDYDSFVFRRMSDPLEYPTPLLEEAFDKHLSFPGGFETAGNICIQSSDPLPLTVLGIIVEYEVERP